MTELAELMEWLCAEKVLLWFDVGLDNGLLGEERALACRVGESGGVRGRSGGNVCSGDVWNLDC